VASLLQPFPAAFLFSRGPFPLLRFGSPWLPGGPSLRAEFFPVPFFTEFAGQIRFLNPYFRFVGGAHADLPLPPQGG